MKLDRLHLLTELDDLALEQLVEDYAEILTLRADVRERGRFEEVEMTNHSYRTVARAAYVALQNAEGRFRAMMVEFGLTPSSRTRVTATPDDADRADPAAAYFG